MTDNLEQKNFIHIEKKENKEKLKEDRRKENPHTFLHERTDGLHRRIKALYAIVGLSILITMSVICYLVFIIKRDAPLTDIVNINKRIARSYDLLNKANNRATLKERIRLIVVNTEQKWKLNNLPGKKLTKEEIAIVADEIYIGEYIYGIPEITMEALFAAESFWNKKAWNKKSEASGLGQVLPPTFKYINEEKLDIYKKLDIFEVRANTRASVRTLHWVQQRLKHDLKRTPTMQEILYGYNAGPDNVVNFFVKDPKTVFKETKTYWKKYQYYLSNYAEGNYFVYWEEYMREKRKKKK